MSYGIIIIKSTMRKSEWFAKLRSTKQPRCTREAYMMSVNLDRIDRLYFNPKQIFDYDGLNKAIRDTIMKGNLVFHYGDCDWKMILAPWTGVGTCAPDSKYYYVNTNTLFGEHSDAPSHFKVQPLASVNKTDV